MDHRSDAESLIANESLNDDLLRDRLIRVLGLTNNEARLYVALLKVDFYSAGELSGVTGIHRSRIYDNLKGLLAKKLAVKTNHEPLRFCAESIENAVSHLIQASQEEHKTRLQEITELGKMLSYFRVYHTGDGELGTRVMPINDTILELERLLETTNSRLWVAKRASGGIVDWFALRFQLERLSRANVDMKFLSDKPVEFGFNTRYSSRITLAFAILDDLAVTFLFPSSTTESGQILVTKNSDYVQFLVSIFLDWWNEME